MSAPTIHILFIEDNLADVRVVQHSLRFAMGIELKLLHCETLEEGVALALQGGVDIVLLDLSLPGVTGLETFLRAHARLSHIPIVVMTAMNDQEMALGALRHGAQDFLVKGRVDRERLLGAIQYSLERHRHWWRKGRATSTWSAFDSGGEPGLRQIEPERFGELCARYAEVLGRARQQRISRIVHNVTEELHLIAGELGEAQASPSDVDELHRIAMDRQAAGLAPQEVRVLMDESQLVLLELYRYLTDHYRQAHD